MFSFKLCNFLQKIFLGWQLWVKVFQNSALTETVIAKKAKPEQWHIKSLKISKTNNKYTNK